MPKMKRYRLILKEEVVRSKTWRMLLTSTGFDNQKFARLAKQILTRKKSISNCKVLFIPTADRQKESISACLKEIIDLGITKDNIVFNNCDPDKLDNTKYDMIYVTGGDENYLMDRINNSGFRKPLLDMINSGVLFVGVSAGSYICGKMVDRPNKSLGLFDYIIEPHQNITHSKNGKVTPDKGFVNISDNQAVLVLDGKVEVIE